MKKIVLTVGVLLMLLLAACGGGEEEAQEVQVAEKDAASEDLDISVDQDNEKLVIESEEGQKIEVAQDQNKSLDMPEDYPEDVMPMYSKEFIAVSMNNPDGSSTVVGMSGDDVSKVQAFYEAAIEEAVVMTTERDEGYFFSMGTIENYTYSVIVEEDTDDDDEMDFETMFSVTMIPMDESEMPAENESEEASETKEPSAAADLVVSDDVIWPGDYPEKALPIYPTGNATAGDAVPGNVILFTEDDSKVVIDYYNDLLKGSDSFSSIDMGMMAMIGGTVDGLEIQLVISGADGTYGDAENFNTVIQITYYKN